MQRTNRRQFIAGIGAVSATVIGAGCTSGSSDGSGDTTTSGNSSDGGSEATTADDGDSSGSEETTASGSGTSMTAGGGGVTEVAAGPNGNLVFKPETVEIPLGGTIRWNFKSPGHNVSAKPEASNVVKLPQGAEPFASYPDGKSYQIVPEGESYTHTFETPGKYVYICVPHVSVGMVGTVIVSK